MKLPALLFAVAFAHTMVAMDEKPAASQPKQSELATTTLRGVVKRNRESGGTIEAVVTYNRQTGVYSGEEFNHGYSMAEWHSSQLRPEDAKAYYLKIKAAQAVELH